MKTVQSQPTMLPQAAAAAGERGLPRSDGEFVEQMVYLLTAPMIVYPGWEDSFKDRWNDVLLHRMAHHQEIFAQQMCTEYEAMLYISSATLVSPPEHDWGQIYFWLFQRYRPAWPRPMTSSLTGPISTPSRWRSSLG